MSQPLSTVTSPGTDNQTLSGDATSSRPPLASFSAFPGLKSFAQSLTALSQTPLSDSGPHGAPQPQHQLSSPSSNSDIEKLERLKKEILDGQNPVYKAVPQPRFLENLYLGRSVQRQNFAPAHPDQITKSPTSSSAQSRPISAHDFAKTDDSEQSTAVNHTGDKPKVAAESISTAASHEQGNTGSGSEPVYPEDASSAISSPQDESKVPSSSAQHSDSSDMLGQGDGKPHSAGAPDLPSQERSILNQPVTFPGSQAVTIHASTDARSALNETALSMDPPYDPKESLRHLESSSIWSDDQYRHVVFPYTSNGTHFDYVHTPSISRNGEQEQGKEWNQRYGYRYDKRFSAPDTYQDRRPIAISGAEFTDPIYRVNDNRDSLEDRAGLGFQRSVSRSSNNALEAAGELLGQQAPSTNDSITTKSLNGGSQTHVAHSVISPTSQFTANDVHLSPGTYTHPVDEKSRFAEDRDLKRSRQSSLNGVSLQTAEVGKSPVLAERISAYGPTPLKDRIGIHIPLEERISSPPVNNSARPTAVLHEGAENRPRLEDRLSSRQPSAETGMSAGREVTRPADLKSIPTPLSLIRARGADGKTMSPLTPVSASGQILQQRAAEQLPYPASRNGAQRNNVPQRRLSVSGSGLQTPQQGTPLDAYRHIYPPSDEDPDRKLTSAYHGERHFIDEGKPHAYERPAFKQREASGAEDRSRPSLEAREWRERNAYPRTYPQRSDSHPASTSPQRVWTPNLRNGRQPGSASSDGRDKQFGRENERRPPPRSWDREEAGYARPLPEVFPPSDDFVREGYPPLDFRERPRIRGRSPSPNSTRRNTYGGSAIDFRPAKRVRNEAFYDDRERPYPDYHARQVSSPPNGYYEPRGPYPARDVHDGYVDRDVPYYDRRVSDMGPPPEPPYAGGAVYSRPDLDRYNAAPPRTV
ncbi:hypothetical protein ACEPAG_7894 [Sanghuangporus baumii]